MRPRPPASVLLSVGTAAAILLVHIVLVAMKLRDWNLRMLWGLACGFGWITLFIDGALRRRAGRVGAATAWLILAGVWALIGTVTVLRGVADDGFDAVGAYLSLGVTLVCLLIGLPLLRPSARAWYEGAASPRETA